MGMFIWCGALCKFQISHRCETHELQRFPQLRRRIEEVVASFLREGLSPAETMIGHLIEMEVIEIL
jgi:dynamin 1-like protein